MNLALLLLVTLAKSEDCGSELFCRAGYYCCENNTECCEEIEINTSKFNFKCYADEESSKHVIQGFAESLTKENFFKDLDECYGFNPALITGYLCAAYRDFKQETEDYIKSGLYSLAVWTSYTLKAMKNCYKDLDVLEEIFLNSIDSLLAFDNKVEISMKYKYLLINGENMYFQVYDNFIPRWEEGKLSHVGYRIGAILREVASMVELSNKVNSELSTPITVEGLLSDLTWEITYSQSLYNDYLYLCESEPGNYADYWLQGYYNWIDFSIKDQWLELAKCLSDQERLTIFKNTCYSNVLLTLANYDEYESQKEDLALQSLQFLASAAGNALNTLKCLNSTQFYSIKSFINGIQTNFQASRVSYEYQDKEFIVEGENIFYFLYDDYGVHTSYKNPDVFKNHYYWYDSDQAFFMGMRTARIMFTSIQFEEVKEDYRRLGYYPEANVTDVEYYERSDDIGFAESFIMVAEALYQSGDILIEETSLVINDLIDSGLDFYKAKKSCGEAVLKKNVNKLNECFGEVYTGLKDALDSASSIANYIEDVFGIELEIEDLSLLKEGKDITKEAFQFAEELASNAFEGAGNLLGSIFSGSVYNYCLAVLLLNLAF